MRHGPIDILEDGGVRLNMNVHYPAEEPGPFSDGTSTGSDANTVRFRRTFRNVGHGHRRGLPLAPHQPDAVG